MEQNELDVDPIAYSINTIPEVELKAERQISEWLYL